MRVALELFYEEVLELIQLLSVISSNYNIVDEYSTCGKYVPPRYCSFLYVEGSVTLTVFGAKIQGSVSLARRKCSATAVSVSYREV